MACLCFFCVGAGFAAELAASGSGAVRSPLRPLSLAAVKIQDSFWAPKLEIYRKRTIPHSWNYMGAELRALQTAAGRKVEGELNGTWGEANLHKFLETMAHSLALRPDPELQRRGEEVIQLLSAAQQPDGYLHAFVTNSKKKPWDPEFLDGSHDGYVLGHMIEAALAWQQATGNTNFLAIACKAADQAVDHFIGPGGRPGFCGHAELEMALAELYRTVPKPQYLQLARAFVEWRGRGKVKPPGDTPRAYFQDRVPLRQQMTLEGHAVRAVFFATGVADLALETGNADYRLAANRFWDSTTRRRMNVVGGIGPRKEHEAFGEDYELPNDGYYESCAACGLADFAQRMFLLERQAEAIDVLERVLYNAVLHGISLDGTNSYYMNPLSDRDNPRYNSWVCCPPNLSRTLMQIGKYAYACGDDDLYVNLFVRGSCEALLRSGKVCLEVNTEYPWNGEVELKVRPEQPMRFVLHLRLPQWCARATLKVDGRSISALPASDTGFLTLDRDWRGNNLVQLSMEMPVQRAVAHPNIRSAENKVALQRGPLVYGFEGLDNGALANLELPAEPVFSVEHRPALLGGITVIKVIGADGTSLTALPFYALANRAKSSQEVWVKQRDFKSDSAWWAGELYRAYRSSAH